MKISGLKKEDFKKVMKEGKSFKEGKLIAKIVEKKEKESKIGILLSKKVFKKAVERNKLKRRLKETIRNCQLEKPIDIVFIPLPGIENDFFILKEKVEKILKRAKVLK